MILEQIGIELSKENNSDLMIDYNIKKNKLKNLEIYLEKLKINYSTFKDLFTYRANVLNNLSI